MRSRWAIALLVFASMLIVHGAHAQKVRVLEFIATKALPAGRAFTFGIITGVPSGVLGNWVYDAINPKPSPAPEPRPTPTPIPDVQTTLERPCALNGCISLNATLFNLDRLGKTAAAPHASRPTINPPPPPPECEKGMEGTVALKRAIDFDDGTLSWQRNAAAAETCYYIAALKHIPLAEYNLADMLLTGDDDVPIDKHTGLQWLEEAALSDFVPAQTRLAVAYDTATEGAESDPHEAAYWYDRAGNQGDAYAQYQMARFNWFGVGGMQRDWVAAFYWLDLALKQGFAASGATMDDMLNQIENDARANNPGGLYVLGIAYEVGVPGRINPDPHNAFLAYRDAQHFGWNSPRYDVEVALSNLCTADPQACH